MAYDDVLAERVRGALRRRSNITERKMFGGVAFLLNGRMCCGVAGSDLVVRVVDAEMRRALARRHVRPMDLTGRPLRGFVFVSPQGLRTDAALSTWVAEGLRYVQENYGTARVGDPAGPRTAASARKRTGSRHAGRRLRRS
ncbi:MAG TPA: TfoX/Sxy family protein [Vicinamibacterales bacterium]|nr:TfoX/Sxy family protein [Vicinamibacterales bacterium]